MRAIISRRNHDRRITSKKYQQTTLQNVHCFITKQLLETNISTGLLDIIVKEPAAIFQKTFEKLYGCTP